MSTAKKVDQELLEQLRRDREKIAAELPELRQRGKRLEEAAAKNSLTGHLRRAIHRSGRPLKKIAAEAGLDLYVLCEFLEGTTNLRSDVLDRLAQAVGAVIQMDPATLLRGEGEPATLLRGEGEAATLLRGEGEPATLLRGEGSS